MISIDGAYGEGGGQVLRSALSLAIATGQSVRLTNIRANRAKPGLMRQHLTAVQAACAICGGRADGAGVGSREIAFAPGSVRPGEYQFSVGTAGSANLVVQTVLAPLLLAPAPSRVTVEGGTHNPYAPPFSFLDQAFAPALRRMGHGVSGTLEAYGFYPAGGGELSFDVYPAEAPSPLNLTERGALKRVTAEAMFSNLPAEIAKRELSHLKNVMNLDETDLSIREVNSNGPGNVVTVSLTYDHLTAVFSSFGQRGVSAEKVAGSVAQAAIQYKASSAAVTPHLADQLLLPMALGAGGSFTTLKPSSHLTTNAWVIEQFLGRCITIESTGHDVCRIGVKTGM